MEPKKKYYWGKADPNKKSKSYPEGSYVNSDKAAYDAETGKLITWDQRDQYDFTQPPVDPPQKHKWIPDIQVPNVLPQEEDPISFKDKLLYAILPSPIGFISNLLFNDDLRKRAANIAFSSSGEYNGDVPYYLYAGLEKLGGIHYDGNIHDDIQVQTKDGTETDYWHTKEDNSSHNYVKAYTLGDFTGFKPSLVGRGRYSKGRYSTAPAVTDKFYTDTLYLPMSMQEDFMKYPIIGRQINKDEIRLLPGTYDAGNHGYTTEPETSTVLFEDVFDVDPENIESPLVRSVASYLNKNTHPIIVNQRVPVVFTNDSNKFAVPNLINIMRGDLSTKKMEDMTKK